MALAVERQELAFGALVALGFHCPLRTGELLAIQFKDLELSQSTGVLSRKAIRDPLVPNPLRALAATSMFCKGQKLWPHSSQHFRHMFGDYMRRFRIAHLNMKPYSMRRGGATYLLQEGVPGYPSTASWYGEDGEVEA